jgi:lipopolysaccharide export system permease protein
MRLLDRYVFLTFLKVFAGSLLAFSVAVVALDFFGRLSFFFDARKVEGTFAEDYSSARLIVHFYLAYLPFLLKDVLPFVTVVAGLFTVTHMLKSNEVAPVVAAGTSVRRLFLPLFLCGLLVSLGHIAFQELVVPALSKEQIALKRFFAGDRANATDELPHLRDGRGTVTRAGLYGFADGSLSSVTVQRPWEQGGFEIWKAPRLEPDGAAWTAPEGVQIQPMGVERLPRDLPPGARVDIGVTPDEVSALASKKGTSELSLSRLRALSEKFPGRRHLRVALHKQLARPFSSFAMLLVGVPILLSVGRSYFAGGALAFVLSAAYYFLDIFFTSLGDRGDIPALLGAYVPLALLLSLGTARVATVPT